MSNARCLFLGFIVTAVIVGLWWCNNRRTRDNFAIKKKQCVMGSPCKIDEDCGGDSFCYMGQCWGYWKGFPMPWSTCRNPYCSSTDPYATCDAAQGKCSPYCKCTKNRRPGGSIASDCFPTCGKPCAGNDECPPGCPACSYGVCSAPNQYQPVL